MRYNREQGSLSVYDVYHEVTPNVPIKNIGHNLRGSNKFHEILAARVVFSNVKEFRKKPTPALHSRDALNEFLDKLRAGLQGPALSEITLNVDRFLTEHAVLLDELWPSRGQSPSAPLLFGSQVDHRRPTQASYEIPLESALKKIEQSINLPIQLKNNEPDY